MKNFSWLQQQVALGKGFYVKADLPNGIMSALYDPSQDLEIVITGLADKWQTAYFQLGWFSLYGPPARHKM